MAGMMLLLRIVRVEIGPHQDHGVNRKRKNDAAKYDDATGRHEAISFAPSALYLALTEKMIVADCNHRFDLDQVRLRVVEI